MAFMFSSTRRRLTFQLVKLLDVAGAVVTIDSDDQRETDSGFGSGNGNRKNRDHHTRWRIRLGTKAPEGDEIKTGGGQHHLDSDEDENGVTPAECGQQPNGEERRRKDEKVL